MKELIESCKKAIAENRCLGCQALENPYFTGNWNCRYSKTILEKVIIEREQMKI